MIEYKESLLIKILKFFGIVKTVEISKEQMCKNAQSVCNHKCDYCAWRVND